MEAAADNSNHPGDVTEDADATRLSQLNSIVATHASYPFTRVFKYGKHSYCGQILQEDVEEFINGLETIHGCHYNFLKGGETPKETDDKGKERETFTINGKEYTKVSELTILAEMIIAGCFSAFELYLPNKQHLMSYPVQVAYECSNAAKPSAPLKRIRVISGGGCNCDTVKVTISTGQPAKSHYALVRVTGWDHNADCKRRSGVQKLRSPSAAALLEDIVKRNIGKTNIDLMVMYMREIARPYMSKLSMTFEEITNFWTAHPAKAPRDADISAAVRPDSTTAPRTYS